MTRFRDACLGVLISCLILIPATGNTAGDGNLHIYCINVSNAACSATSRQGDSTLFVSPTEKRLLIDGGGGGSCGSDYVIATLKRVLPTSGMDYMVATNWDNDHASGLDNVAKDNYMPPTIYDIGYVDETNPPSEYTSTFSDGMRKTPDPGDTIDLEGGVTLTFVTMKGYIIGGEYVDPGDDENSMSIGALIQYGGFDYVSCGDLTSNVEDKLGAALKSRGRRIDVLRVSHHGADTSTSNVYCSDIQPEFAIISVGAGQGYGHPTQAVINHLNGKTDSGSPYSPAYPAVKTIYLTEDPHNGTASNVQVLQPKPSNGGSIHITVGGDGCYTISNEGPGTNSFNDGPYSSDEGPPCVPFTPTPSGGPTPTPRPISKCGFQLHVNKTNFSTRDRIVVAADFKWCTVPFYPFIRIKDPHNRYTYIQRIHNGRQSKLTDNTKPFWPGGPFVIDWGHDLDYYPVLDLQFSGAAPGRWTIEGAYVGAKTGPGRIDSVEITVSR